MPPITDCDTLAPVLTAAAVAIAAAAVAVAGLAVAYVAKLLTEWRSWRR